VAYNVYDSATGVRLTSAPVEAPEYEDSRIEWGATRCYAVRAVEVIGQSAVESEAGEPRCEKLVDTFAPAAPKGLSAVSTDGAINLIWEPNAEADLAGYDVLRGRLPEARMERLTEAPIPDTSFLDNVQTGVRFVYVVVAVDKAGNRSAPSNRAEESAR
jgi:fibronectin type 3 domain-containing protein